MEPEFYSFSILSSTPDNKLPEYPRKLVLLSADPAEEVSLRDHLKSENHGRHELQYAGTLDELKSFHQKADYHGVLLDIRPGHAEALEAIQWIGTLQSPVALICLCKNHEQLQDYTPVIHLIDDYILADPLPHGELCTRISHAIRRRLKEQKLLHEQGLLRSLLENVPDAIFFKDLQSRFTKVNRAMLKKYGQGKESIIGMTDFDLFAEEHARQAYEDEQRIIETGEPIIGKIEKETFEDGSIKWVNTTKVPLRDESNQIIGTMGISRNITDLKKIQDELAKEEALLKTIINHALAGIFVKDLEGRYILVNKRHSDYLGAKSPEDVEGKMIRDFFNEEFAAMVDKADQQIMETRRGIEGMIDHREVLGRPEKWLLTSKVPLIDNQNRCTGLVGISIDVTQQKENEITLKKTIEILEETKLQLIEAEKLKTVGRLAAGIAHEVKNPLNIVSLGAEYLQSQLDGPKVLVQIIEEMKLAVEKANTVIHQLLDYSSPHELATEPENINDVIEQVLSMLRHNFKEAHVTVEKDLAKDLPFVAIDIQKIDQVFINLFLNAIGAMEKGGTLTIRSFTQQMKKTGSNVSSEMTELFRVGDRIVTVEIADTGHGIEDKNADKLFDPFYSTQTTGEGTGLGLSVTRSIVEMHRGMITLTNRKDILGACATLHFPAYPDSDD